MFEIAVEQHDYTTYLLRDVSAPSSISVVPERGGIITTWTHQGKHILYLDAARFRDPTLSVRGGIPLLFPICGNLPNDSYQLNRHTYTLKQHGFGRTLPWLVTGQSTADKASLTLTLRSSDETKAVYPFDFILNYTYELQSNTLTLIQTHTNLSQDPMPFSTGIHPYFEVADKQQLEFGIPSTQYQVKSDPTLQSFTGTFDFEQDEIDVAFVNLTGTNAYAIDRQRQHKITIDFDKSYSTLVFWTVRGKPFYCLEPWTGPRNALNTGQNILTVPPGETLETVIRLTISSLAR